MKILLSNHALKDVGGTEKWTYAMAEELTRRGHDVGVFTFMIGTTSDKLQSFCRVHTQVPDVDEYDVLLSNHNTTLGILQPLRCPKIHTSHGPGHRLEIPNNGADLYVGVSNEVIARYAAEGFWMEMIPNGINLDEFAEGPALRETPRVLSMCKQKTANEIVQMACMLAGLDLTMLHYTDQPVWDVAPMMRNHDIVIGCGRTVYEALACGRQPLVFDWRQKAKGPTADGYVLPDNIDRLRQSNFSGRHHEYPWAVGEVTKALRAYATERAPDGWARQWAEQNANIRDRVTEYEALIDRALSTQPVPHDCDLTAEYT